MLFQTIKGFVSVVVVRLLLVKGPIADISGTTILGWKSLVFVVVKMQPGRAGGLGTQEVILF